jgi:hypothetical protein
VRGSRDKRRGDKGGKTKDNPTDASHRGRQLNRKSWEIKTKEYKLWTLDIYTGDGPSHVTSHRKARANSVKGA